MGTEPLLVLLGAGLAVEWTSLGQFMIARPVVAGFLAGVVTGDPVTGLVEWTPTETDSARAVVVLQVYDARGARATQEYLIDVVGAWIDAGP